MSNNVYFLTAHAQPAKVSERIKNIIAEESDVYELAPNQWMVKHEGSAQDLAEKAGVRGGDDFIGKGLVLSVGIYSGRANSSLWEWLKDKGF